jgi:hypothetical protein
MNTIINSLDNQYQQSHTGKISGDNGHSQYTWSNNMNELFTQFYFQLVRTADINKITTLEILLEKMIIEFKSQHPIYTKFMKNVDYLNDLYKLIGHTRDIVSGKGEYNLAYMQLFIWYKHFPELAIMAFRNFVINSKTHPYGSWKDFKYLCEYVKNHSQGGKEQPLIDECINILVEQLRQDSGKLDIIKKIGNNQDSIDSIEIMNQSISNYKISLAGKWCPREKGRFAWIYKKIVKKWVPDYFKTAGDNIEQYNKAMKKGSRELRRTLSALNHYLDTTQIKMCGKKWREINFNNVTSLTIHKNKNSFLNKTRNYTRNQERYPNDDDRKICAQNFINHIQNVKQRMIEEEKKQTEIQQQSTGQTQTQTQTKDDIKKDIAKLNSKRLSVYEMVHEAIKLNKRIKYLDNTNNNHNLSSNGNDNNNRNDIQNMIDLLNLQWDTHRNHTTSSLILNKNSYSKKVKDRGIGNMIAMVDTSGSMDSDNGIPLYSAVGLGIRISELASEGFKNRILTFSATPNWINLDDKETFTDKVSHIINSGWGLNTNFYAALSMILDIIIKESIPPEIVSNMVLVVLSDMQIDNASTENLDTLYEVISKKYANAGLQSSYNKPYEPPYILFWNLRNTNGFPTLSTQKNVSMLSGFSSQLLNAFCEKGYDSLREYTPYKLIHEILNKPRYKIMENNFNSYIKVHMNTIIESSNNN